MISRYLDTLCSESMLARFETRLVEVPQVCLSFTTNAIGQTGVDKMIEGNRCIMQPAPCNVMNDKGHTAMMETTFLKVGKRCINVCNIGWTEAGGDPDKGWIDLIFSNHQKLRLENQDAEKFMTFLEGNSTKLM
jgi:hypothetical protein